MLPELKQPVVFVETTELNPSAMCAGITVTYPEQVSGGYRVSEISDRSQYILKSLIELYIDGGQPVASRRLSEYSALSLSSATVRNILSELEGEGFVESPHTSAGRVPTTKAYRLFVDSLIQVQPIESENLDELKRQLDPDKSSQELVETASGLLSEVTHMAGLVTLPKRDQVILRHVEFLSLGDHRILVILVLDDHEVQNRVIYTKEPYTDVQLREAANFLNHQFSGQILSLIRDQLISSMKTDREHMNRLMETTLAVAEKAFVQDEESDYVLAGQENLISEDDPIVIADIRELFQAFAIKADILDLLDRCMGSPGIQLFIGSESGYQPLDDFSFVTAPYGVAGDTVGVLGVIGPTRMAYDRVIPVVEATARELSAALDSSRN